MDEISEGGGVSSGFGIAGRLMVEVVVLEVG